MPRISFRIVEQRNEILNMLYSWQVRLSSLPPDSAQKLIQYMQESMDEPKSGRIYSKYGVPHQASAPGEAPAVWSGELYDSFRIRALNQYAVQVYSIDPKAELLEYGGGYVEARPYARPAAERLKGEFLDSVLSIMRRP